MKKINYILTITLIAGIICSALSATASDLLKNGNFNDRSSNWDTKASPEINAETVYGGKDSKNYVAEIDAQATLSQQISLNANTTYQLIFNATRRTGGGTIAEPGILVQVVGVQTGKSYASQTYTFKNTVFAYTAQTLRIAIPAGAKDKDFYLQLQAYNNSTTLGVIVDNIALAPLSVLPVQFVDFKASLQNNKAIIKWQTANEINNDYFAVEAGTDGLHFDSIGRVNSQPGTGDHNYIFNDNKVRSGIWFYRLVQTDIDGKRSHSKTISLQYSSSQSATNVFPSIASSSITIQVAAAQAGNTQLIIYNAAGNIVLHQQKILTSGMNQFSADISTLAKGTYFVQLQNNGLSSAASHTIQKM